MLVVGPGLRKKIVKRGDGVNFPKILDQVEVMSQASIFHNGRLIHKEPPSRLEFYSGLSGKCIHIQILGANNLPVADLHGSSDPYVEATFNGKSQGITRVRPRNLNPRWKNETFIIPMEDIPKMENKALHSQEGIIKLEVFDYDWVRNLLIIHSYYKLILISTISSSLLIRQHKMIC